MLLLRKLGNVTNLAISDDYRLYRHYEKEVVEPARLRQVRSQK
jgi:hypothetical protein